MRRRKFIICGAATAWPITARSQQPSKTTIGFLRSTSASDSGFLIAALRQGLKEAGYTAGENIAIEYRWGEGVRDRLPALATDLVNRNVSAIVAAGNEALIAARSSTAIIPIVFALGDDPVRLGFVTSLNRPGGNITGVTFETTDLAAKRMELVHELVPQADTIGYLMNPNSVGSDVESTEVQRAANDLGRRVLVVKIEEAAELARAFDDFARQHAGAVVVGSGAFFLGQRDQLAALAASHVVPAIYDQRGYVVAGGLMSYGASITDAYRQTGVYVGRILHGENPARLPIVQSAKIEFVVNLKIARTLGLTIPQSLLARADEVIE